MLRLDFEPTETKDKSPISSLTMFVRAEEEKCDVGETYLLSVGIS